MEPTTYKSLLEHLSVQEQFKAWLIKCIEVACFNYEAHVLIGQVPFAKYWHGKRIAFVDVYNAQFGEFAIQHPALWARITEGKNETTR